MTAVSLVRYEAARNALAAARSVDEVKNVRDLALAMSFYAKQAKDRTLIDDATDIRLRAELRLGEMIAAQKETVGLATGAAGIGRSASAVPDEYRTQPPTLAEAGIDKKLSARAQKLANLSPEEFAQRLASAKREAIASIEMPSAARAAEKKQRRTEREAELAEKQRALPSRHYGVILCDPPWEFRVYSDATGSGRTAASHYPTMTPEQLRALDVPSLAAPDCVLFMWATPATLAQAVHLIEAWGFEYKTEAVWAKDKIGLGFWFRNQHESVLVATRGSPPCPAHGTQFSSLFDARRDKHSTKPTFIHNVIEAYFPNLPKIELFARGAARDDWSAWGNEAPLEAGAST